jgi:hypothetical protein
MLREVVEEMPLTPGFEVRHDAPRTVELLDSSEGKDISAACNAALSKVVATVV